ncbi:tripartite tricarboxylate transporter TctB family protein [Microvirga massiliensis]|uniref:tripartite tricarboxylate transporter TctB family protein n=1 Tax=Microvirga massiliensis TaxID=1033741 RepID=UPI001FCE1DAB|nr:tripartite tricarboxylate transporter TctB family protein [Microvirga massiliensis]
MSTRTVEIVVSGLFVILALVIMYDNWRIGARWASDGPEAGYFPFYIGLIMLVASSGTLLINLFAKSADRSNFVERSQFKQVLQVLIPTAGFVFLIWLIGIYFAAAIFITFFMWWLGKYPIYRILPIAILVPLALFLMFEVYFLVPLPKGPIETALGF